MGVMSIRELNANVSRALSQAESGEDIVVTRNGKPILRITRDGIEDSEERETRRQMAVAELLELLKTGLPLGGPATYEERTGG